MGSLVYLLRSVQWTQFKGEFGGVIFGQSSQQGHQIAASSHNWKMVIHYKLKRKSQIKEKEAADGRLPEKGKTIKIYFCRNKILRETYNLRNKGFYFQRQKMLFPIFSLPICSLPFFI